MCDFVLAVATGNANKIREIQAVLGPLGVRALTAAEAGAPADFSPEESGATFEENSLIKALALFDALSDAAAGRGAPRIDGFVADDSGLCVDALGGAPGVYSARFAEMPPLPPSLSPQSSPAASRGDADYHNNAKLLRLLDGKPDAERTARFVCVVTLILPRGSAAGSADDASGAFRKVVCRGECEGRILTAPRGSHGFGYDPVFVPTDIPDVPGAAGQDGRTFAPTDAPGAAGQDGRTFAPPDVPGAAGQDGRTFAEMAPDEKNAISHRARALAELYAALSKIEANDVK
jgi:XTP/dITP diphosphohydrolase